MFDALMGMAALPNWAPTDDRWYPPYGGVRTQAGVDVSEQTALAFVTVYACVSKRAKTIASLPVHVVEKVSPRERRPVDHSLAELLSGQANPEATGITVRETMMANLDLWGAGYAECTWSNDNRELLGLTPLMSRDVTPKRNENDELVFEHRPPGTTQPRVLTQQQIWHIPGLSLNGVTGLSPIGYNREAIGLGIAAQTFASSFFGNGAWAGGIIKRDPESKIGGKAMTPTAGMELVASLEEKLRGPDKAFGFALLREGMTLEQLKSMPLQDAQFVAVRGLTRIEICGIFDVPPSMIHDLENGTFNNTEQQSIVWVRDSLLPTTVRIEMSAKAKFFPDEPLYLRHNLSGILRGDFETQMEGFAKGREWGIFSVNDCLEMMDRNSVEGGDERLTPLNYGVLGEPRPAIVSAPSREGQEDAKVQPFAPLLADAARRITSREIKTITSAFKRRVKEDNIDGFATWLDKFYTEHVSYFRDAITPVIESFQQATGVTVTPGPQELADDYASVNYDTLLAMLEQPAGVPALLERWKEHKAQSIADGLLGILTKAIEGENDG